MTETPADTGWDIVFTPQALAGVFDHFLSGDGGVGGILTGVPHRCPRSGRRWVRVERAIRAPTALPDGSGATALESALLGSGERPAGDRAVVGWYHSHAKLGVHMTDAEQRFHDLRFGEPWQFALILVARSEPVGGVFQEPALTLPRGRKYVAFYELPASRRSDGSLDTLIRWRNYTTDARVTPADAGSVRALAASVSGEASAPEERSRLEEPTTPVRPERAPGPERVSTPQESGGGRPGPARVVVPGERRANRSRTRTAVAAAIVTLGAGAAGAAWWFTRTADGESGDEAVFSAPEAELESSEVAPGTEDGEGADPATGADTAGRADTVSGSPTPPPADRPGPPPESG